MSDPLADMAKDLRDVADDLDGPAMAKVLDDPVAGKKDIADAVQPPAG